MFQDFGIRLHNSIQAIPHVVPLAINNCTSAKGAAVIANLNPLIQAHNAEYVPAIQLYCSFILEIFERLRSNDLPIGPIVVFMEANAAAQVLVRLYQLGSRWCIA